ncbi:imelysin family protein [Breoghania sp. L-A4]|uniref:imelysin family protein n=1 Tax=Breoghania sp. L-A4 TaxID=2304600 RepID=UPI000E35B42E|nr:imelysin family protein [Breoghania sp. L-A4]AXS42122.1 hypothetical protein D1F64_21615 [Breoghania sp. L-A4]
MKRWLSSLAMIPLLLAAGPARADPAAVQAHVVAHAVDGYIRPAFTDFERAGTVLRSEIDGFCESPSLQGHEAVGAAYRAALEGYSRIEFLRFGPLLEDHRLERLVFWPDRKSTGRRQAEAIVRDHDASVLTLDSLQGKSVAVQGLSALEAVLFDGARTALLAGGEDGRFRCAYARVIAENVAVIGAELVAGWTGPDNYGALLLEPGPDNPVYRSHQESAAEILGSITTGLQIIRDQKLLPVIGDSIDKVKPKRAPFRRSGNTMAMCAAGASGLRNFVVSMALEGVLGEESSWLANSIPFELANAARVLRSVPEPLTKTAKDPGVYGKLAYVNLVLGGLRQTVGEDLAAALFTIMGFNSLDGD